MSNNPLEASIHLSLHNDVSRALAQIGSEILGLNGHVEKLKGGLKDITSGAIKLSAAFGMAEFIKDLTTANGLLERQLNIFRMSGNSEADTRALRAAAYDAAVKVRGVGVVEQAKLARELSSALQDNPGARAVLPDFARAKAVLSFATGRDNAEDTTRLAKMIELRGGAVNPKTDKIDPELFRKELDAATKAIVVGQGLLTTNDLQQMIKQGGPAMKNFRGNPAAFWADTIALGEDMGGARAGTATTAIARQVLGGIMTSNVAAEWQRLGMLSKEGDGWAYNKKGKIEISDPAKAIHGYANFQHGGVEEFVDKVVRPAFDKAGIKAPDDINAEMYKFGSTETARRAYGLYLSNDAQIRAVHDRYYKAMGVDGYDKVVTKDLIYNEEAVKTAFEGLKTALGDAAGLAPALGSIADGINQLSKATSEHPGIAKGITMYGGTLAAGIGGYGAVQMVRGVMAMRNGFGLPKAAGELSAAAAALEGAAGKLGGLGPAGIGGAGKAEAVAKGAGGYIQPSWGKFGLSFLNLGFAAYNATPEAADLKPDKNGKWSIKPIAGDQVKSFDEWFKANMPAWMQPGAGQEFAKKISTSLDGVETSISKEIGSWPGKLGGAISAMGTDIVNSISGAFSGLGGKIAKLLHLSSFEEGGGAGEGSGGGFIKASYEGGDAANDNTRRIVGRILGDGGGAGFNTRGVKNQNPGNIGYGAWARAHGAVGGAGADSGHLVAVFPSFESGYAAMGALALSKYRGGSRSIDAIIASAHGWTPGNHQAAANVAATMGISASADAHLDDPAMMAKFASALSKQELGPAGARYAREHLHSRTMPEPPPKPHVVHVYTTAMLHLDGKQITKVVTRQQARNGMFPNAVGGMDTHSSYASPGTPLFDCA